MMTPMTTVYRRWNLSAHSWWSAKHSHHRLRLRNSGDIPNVALDLALRIVRCVPGGAAVCLRITSFPSETDVAVFTNGRFGETPDDFVPSVAFTVHPGTHEL